MKRWPQARLNVKLCTLEGISDEQLRREIRAAGSLITTKFRLAASPPNSTPPSRPFTQSSSRFEGTSGSPATSWNKSAPAPVVDGYCLHEFIRQASFGGHLLRENVLKTTTRRACRPSARPSPGAPCRRLQSTLRMRHLIGIELAKHSGGRIADENFEHRSLSMAAKFCSSVQSNVVYCQERVARR